MNEDKDKATRKMVAEMRNLELWKSELWDHFVQIETMKDSLQEAKESAPVFKKIMAVAGKILAILKEGKVVNQSFWTAKFLPEISNHESVASRLSDEELESLASKLVSRIRSEHKRGISSTDDMEDAVGLVLEANHYPCVRVARYEATLKRRADGVAEIISERIAAGDTKVIHLAADWWKRVRNGESAPPYKGEPPTPKHVQVVMFNSLFRIRQHRNPTNAELLDLANPALKAKGLPALTDSDVSKAKKKSALLKSRFAVGRGKK